MTPFDFVNSISSNKRNLMRDTENDEFAEKAYVPFVVNRALSYHTDTLLYANEMSRYGGLDNIMQYEYLLNSIRPGKRYSKWAKSTLSEDTTAISKYYKVNVRKAEEYRKLIPDERLQEIKNFINNS